VIEFIQEKRTILLYEEVLGSNLGRDIEYSKRVD
jgi:hypothetical protein